MSETAAKPKSNMPKQSFSTQNGPDYHDGRHNLPPMTTPYRLWTAETSWCSYQVPIEDEFKPAIRSLFDPDSAADGQLPPTDVALIPEPFGQRGEWAISVRHSGHTIGYVAEADSPAWAGVVRRVISSGCIPTTAARISSHEYDGLGGSTLYANIFIALGEPDQALPVNNPPTAAYTLLPMSSTVQVTKEEQYYDALLKFVPQVGRGALFVTLHERPTKSPKSKPLVEVRIDDDCVGQLTPQMSLRYIPMIRRLADRKLLTASRGDIIGSAVAAEVRINGIKANEVDNDFLNYGIALMPTLVPEQRDPRSYDISNMLPLLQPLPAVQLPPPPAEPPEGSLVRFDSGRYNYVAVRRSGRWETTASQDWGIVNEIMSWPELAAPARKFERAYGWTPVDPGNDPRVRELLAVVRFTIAGQYFGAINIARDRSYEGDWYTTITEQAEQNLPIGDRPSWSELSHFCRSIEIPTRWETVE
jgi:hypothetical protein